MKHEIVKRAWGYVSMDCYGYEAHCSCGKVLTGWSIKECEEEILKHLKSKSEPQEVVKDES